MSGYLVMAALKSAVRKFGPPQTWHRPQVTAWVREQCRAKLPPGVEAPEPRTLPGASWGVAEEDEDWAAEPTEDGWR